MGTTICVIGLVLSEGTAAVKQTAIDFLGQLHSNNVRPLKLLILSTNSLRNKISDLLFPLSDNWFDTIINRSDQAKGK